VKPSPINAKDKEFLDLAIKLANRGLGQTWPNPSVGAVVVVQNNGFEVVARGWTHPGGRPHAERVALDQAGTRAKGATLYVSLEPCAHRGQTPPCVDAIIEAGIGRVVCAMRDPDARVAGKGFARLSEAGIEVALALEPGEASWLALGHILRQGAGRPFVQLKLAVGADGKLAPADGAGRPVWVTSQDARDRGHLLRAKADAIVVGRGTAVADNPELTCRLPGLLPRSPLRVVIDSNLRLETDARLVGTIDTVGLWVLCGESADPQRRAALEDKGVRVIVAPMAEDGRIDLNSAFGILADEGLTRVLVEGGPTLASACFDAGLIDEAIFFTGCEDVGEIGLLPFGDATLDRLTRSRAYRLASERSVGPDQMAIYRRAA
jgi:diaminohydroxyphosphoribosylaminopyrimidine deaminase/5-amino-6-(5-phosphoribosylamino)uracil reductase